MMSDANPFRCGWLKSVILCISEIFIATDMTIGGCTYLDALSLTFMGFSVISEGAKNIVAVGENPCFLRLVEVFAAH